MYDNARSDVHSRPLSRSFQLLFHKVKNINVEEEGSTARFLELVLTDMGPELHYKLYNHAVDCLNNGKAVRRRLGELGDGTTRQNRQSIVVGAGSVQSG